MKVRANVRRTFTSTFARTCRERSANVRLLARDAPARGRDRDQSQTPKNNYPPTQEFEENAARIRAASGSTRHPSNGWDDLTIERTT